MNDVVQLLGSEDQEYAQFYRWLKEHHAWWLLKHFPAQEPYVDARDVFDDAIRAAIAARA